MKWIVLLMLIAFVSGQLYTRVDPFMVSARIDQFLEYHKINNCFERLLGENELHLKCLRNNALVDVHLYNEEELYV